MREIDLKTWPRRRHFELFNSFDHPHFNLCVNLDITEFHKATKKTGVSFTVALVYAITRSANAIPEFCIRIRSGRVVEHSLVSPSITVIAADDLFSFCTIPFNQEFKEFADSASSAITRARKHPSLENEPDRDDLLFMTAIPWVSFTSFMHPMQLHPADSIPRFAWGKFFEDGPRLKMPLSVQGHHALMDGIHMAKFYAEMETCLSQPEFIGGE